MKTGPKMHLPNRYLHSLMLTCINESCNFYFSCARWGMKEIFRLLFTCQTLVHLTWPNLDWRGIPCPPYCPHMESENRNRSRNFLVAHTGIAVIRQDVEKHTHTHICHTFIHTGCWWQISSFFFKKNIMEKCHCWVKCGIIQGALNQK